ncbi:hypothetical protein [Poseidonocella pacifica]|uniref:hypothetical protein n=1 Tax=Poseidonocella pacifica TaxID=871651 RepID=UPI0015875F1A|nr:hypothetical protein [Poseidonocella pacifica]
MGAFQKILLRKVIGIFDNHSEKCDDPASIRYRRTNINKQAKMRSAPFERPDCMDVLTQFATKGCVSAMSENRVGGELNQANIALNASIASLLRRATIRRA